MEVLRNMRSRLLSHASVIASQPSYHLKTHLYCTKFSFSSKNNTLVVKPTMKNIKSMRKSSFSKRTVDAVEAYKTIYGNLDIKQSFVIPHPDDGVEMDPRWPDSLHGLRLGSRVYGMRAEFRNGLLKSSGESDLTDTLFAKLEELGFVFCKKSQQIRLLRLAIKTYKSVYGDLNIPKFFMCPVDDPTWPSETWGMKLGFNVGNIRNRGNFPELEDELRAMGMVFKPSLDRRAGDSVLVAVDKFYELYGHYKIPLEFQIPTDSKRPYKKRSEMVQKPLTNEDESSPLRWPYKPVDPLPYDLWPPEVRGMKLGFKFSNLYYSRASARVRNVLQEKGAFTEMEAPAALFSRSEKYALVLLALKEYKENFGHLNVPESFVISNHCDVLRYGVDWSVSSHDEVQNIPQNVPEECEVSSEEKQNIDTSQHAINSDKTKSTEMFTDYCRAYVPSEEYRSMKWSKKLIGLKLGLKVRDLRFKAKYLARNRSELDAIGFNWKDHNSVVDDGDGVDILIDE